MDCTTQGYGTVVEYDNMIKYICCENTFKGDVLNYYNYGNKKFDIDIDNFKFDRY